MCHELNAVKGVTYCFYYYYLFFFFFAQFYWHNWCLRVNEAADEEAEEWRRKNIGASDSGRLWMICLLLSILGCVLYYSVP